MSSTMMNKLKAYPIDDSGIWNKGQAFLGSIIKYVTPQCLLEKLPRVHPETRLVITADAIIDNRNELMSMFDVPISERELISDSQVILMAYIKWGEDCPKYLVGDFAFAIWDEKKKELFCARDHVGKRTLYFYQSSNVFAFCTTMSPLLCVKDDSNELNDSWVADFLSLEGPVHEVDCNQTVYKDIMQLLPAHSLILNTNGMLKKCYWNPLNEKEIHFKRNEEYEEAFREVFFEAVHCRLRSIGSVGVMLSGGLDSGSVACVAAKQLREEGKRLKAFTSVPLANYKNWLPRNIVADEREYIKAILDMNKNIDATYCDCQGINSINNSELLIQILEQPYKFIQNFFWMNELASKAAKSGCTVLLDGQFGNYNFSFGDVTTYVSILIKQGKLLTLLKDIYSYCKVTNHKYSVALKYYLDIYIEEKKRSISYKLKKKSKIDIINELMMPVSSELAIKWGVLDRFEKEGIGPYYKCLKDLNEIRNFDTSPTLFSQTGSAETKISLYNGIARRDPTKDKRVIEFCCKLPLNQFFMQGQERSLIRRAMVDILPDKVRLNYNIKGIQSADWVQRLQPEWKSMCKELECMLQRGTFKYYIDANKVKKVINDIGNLINEDKNLSVEMIVISLIFGRFINGINKTT
jgi:asparagine synthase (glutamine-hydrolysing)